MVADVLFPDRACFVVWIALLLMAGCPAEAVEKKKRFHHHAEVSQVVVRGRRMQNGSSSLKTQHHDVKQLESSHRRPTTATMRSSEASFVQSSAGLVQNLQRQGKLSMIQPMAGEPDEGMSPAMAVIADADKTSAAQEPGPELPPETPMEVPSASQLPLGAAEPNPDAEAEAAAAEAEAAAAAEGAAAAGPPAPPQGHSQALDAAATRRLMDSVPILDESDDDDAAAATMQTRATEAVKRLPRHMINRVMQAAVATASPVAKVSVSVRMPSTPVPQASGPLHKGQQQRQQQQQQQPQQQQRRRLQPQRRPRRRWAHLRRQPPSQYAGCPAFGGPIEARITFRSKSEVFARSEKDIHEEALAMLMSNGLTEGQAEELAVNGYISGLSGPVVTVVTRHGIHRGLRNHGPLASRTDIFPATLVWTLRCIDSSRQSPDSDGAFEEVKLRTGWGGRRRRRWFRRLRRRFRRFWRRVKRVARRTWRAVKRVARVAFKKLVSFGKCAIGAAVPLIMGNPGAAGKLASCATKKVNELKNETKEIFQGVKKEVKTLKNDVASVAKQASAGAAVTIAHLYKCGEKLKKLLKAGKITAKAAVQRMEDQSVIEVINSTVTVETQLQKVNKHAVKGAKIIAKDALKVANSSSSIL